MGRSHSVSLFSRCRSTTATSSYVSPLLDGLLEGLGEDLHVGGSLHFGLPVGGDFEAHLQCWKQKVRTHGRSNRVSTEPSERKRTPRRNKDSVWLRVVIPSGFFLQRSFQSFVTAVAC